jgi:hypothetical protein
MVEPNYSDIKGVYPFIHPKRITVIEKGVYKKNKATFVGPSRIYNKEKGKLVSTYMGVVIVDHDTVMLPLKANKLNKFKAAMYLVRGFKVRDKIVNKFPLILNNSKYYQASLDNYKKFQDGKFNNASTSSSRPRT